MRKVERLVNLPALLLDTPRPLTLDEVAEMVPGYEASGESLRRMFERAPGPPATRSGRVDPRRAGIQRGWSAGVASPMRRSMQRQPPAYRPAARRNAG
jgi:hypothetical protein